MSITYNPEGGDMGRAEIKPITALELQIVVPHVANILEELELRRAAGDNPFKYAFEIHLMEKKAALLVIQATSYNLPPHVFWYEADGKHLFEIRGVSGGVASAFICYLYTKP